MSLTPALQTAIRLMNLLRQLYEYGPCSTKSNIARDNADLIAICSCEGWITVISPDGDYGREWRLTPTGIDRIFEKEMYS
jgi:hypothetical protein